MKNLALTCLISLLLSIDASWAATWFVKTDGSDANNGSSWSQAFQTIQKGIDAASGGDEIWVAMGTYLLQHQIEVDKSVEIYGGFDGTESARDQRDFENNVTTVDADSITRSFYITADAFIDGFSVTRGRTEGQATLPEEGNHNGAGIFVVDSAVNVRNCHFFQNDARFDGGGIYVLRSSAVVEDSIFTSNIADHGGAVGISKGSSASVRDCIFIDNFANNHGGAISLEASLATQETDLASTFIDCVFEANRADFNGGAVVGGSGKDTFLNAFFIENSSVEAGGAISGNVVAINSVFFRNMTVFNGGAIITRESTITNCTFYGNFTDSSTSSRGGAVFGAFPTTITNSILWANTASEGSQVFNHTGFNPDPMEITFSNVQGGYPGMGNLDIDPMLVDPENEDFHLTPESPCVDMGTTDAPALPEKDFEGDPRVFGAPDMGVDEFIPPPSPGPELALDTFSEAGDPLLHNHVSDSGHGWSNERGSRSHNLRIDSGQELCTLDFDSFGRRPAYLLNVNPSSPDYSVSVNVRWDGSTSGRASVGARYSGAYESRSVYLVEVANTGDFRLWRVHGGQAAQIGSAQQVIVEGDFWHELKIETAAQAIRAFWDGEEVISALDFDISGPGNPALGSGLRGSLDNTGFEYDNLLVETLPALGEDTFTEDGDPLLETHLSDSGHTWTDHRGNHKLRIDSAAGVVEVDPAAGKRPAYTLNVNPTGADYLVSVNVKWDGETSARASAGLRYSGAYSSRDAYLVEVSNTGDFRIWKVEDGVTHQLGSTAFVTVWPEQWHTLRIEAQGSIIRTYWDGAEVTSVFDLAITAPGQPALGSGLRGSMNNIGFVYDEFKVEQR